jgi:ketosteroid isomerase-like protein
MSSKNVEILRRTLERMGSEPEAFWAILDPEVEWDQTQQLPDAEVVRGYDAVRDATHRWLGTFDDYSRDLEELIDAGDDVITVLRLRGKGKGGGAPIEGRVAQVWTFRDGKVVRYRDFPKREDALKAAGLVHD